MTDDALRNAVIEGGFNLLIEIVRDLAEIADKQGPLSGDELRMFARGLQSKQAARLGGPITPEELQGGADGDV